MWILFVCPRVFINLYNNTEIKSKPHKIYCAWSIQRENNCKVFVGIFTLQSMPNCFSFDDQIYIYFRFARSIEGVFVCYEQSENHSYSSLQNRFIIQGQDDLCSVFRVIRDAYEMPCHCFTNGQFTTQIVLQRMSIQDLSKFVLNSL